MLTPEQESALKKEILRQILHKEIETLRRSPGIDKLENDTILLRFLFHKFILDFPFFKTCPGSFWKDVDTFVKKIHSSNISSSEERGKLTELDIWINRLEKVGVILFRNLFRTNISQPDENPAPVEPVKVDLNSKEEEEEDSTLSPIFLSPIASPLSDHWKPEGIIQEEENNLSEEYIQLFKEFMNKLLYSGEILQLYDLIKNVKDVEELPPNYLMLLNGSYKVMAFYLLKKYHIDAGAMKSRSSLRMVYSMFPFFGMKTLLRFSNPLKIVRGMVDLFLAKPFGNRNLAQQFVGIWMGSHDREETPEGNSNSEKNYYHMSRKKLIQLISNPQLVDKVTNYVNREDSVRQLELEEEIHVEENLTVVKKIEKIKLVLKHPHVNPKIRDSVIRSITEDKLIMIYQFYRKEIRLRDYTQVKNLLSDNDIIHTIKETVGTFCEPLMKLYKQADVGIVISSIKELLKDWINLQSSSSANTKQTPKVIEEVPIDDYFTKEEHVLYQQYTEILRRFGKGLYQFFHETAGKDDGLVQSLIIWFVGQMEYFQKSDSATKSKPKIDLKSIFEQHITSPEQEATLLHELDALKVFYKDRNDKISQHVKVMMNDGSLSKNSYDGLFDKYVSNEELEDINFGDEILIPPPCPMIASLVPSFTAMIGNTSLESENSKVSPN